MTTAGNRPLVRPPAVAGAFYPSNPERLRALVIGQLRDAEARFTGPTGAAGPVGILVPHAGLAYSGAVAATAWRTVFATTAASDADPLTVVLLGTNHRAGWLDGIGVWDRGAWSSPLGEVSVDADLAAAILALGPPFGRDLEAHLEEHSLEVQLPLLQIAAPMARVVPLAVSAGVDQAAVDAGQRLGELLATRRSAGERLLVAISTDMAHYPPARGAELVTTQLRPPILACDPLGLAIAERRSRTLGIPGLACGMCGIEPAVSGLAAMRAMGTTRARALAEATSADVGGPRDRTVGYLAVRFD